MSKTLRYDFYQEKLDKLLDNLNDRGMQFELSSEFENTLISSRLDVILRLVFRAETCKYYIFVNRRDYFRALSNYQIKLPFYENDEQFEFFRSKLCWLASGDGSLAMDSERIDTDYQNYPEEKLSREAARSEWIHLHGSESLRRGLIEGYPVDQGYRMERLNKEYPGFCYSHARHTKIDTPTLDILNACIAYKGAYASTCDDKVYITIDDYINGSQIAKEIRLSIRQKISRITTKDYLYILYKMGTLSFSVLFLFISLFQLQSVYTKIFLKDFQIIPSRQNIDNRSR